LTEQEEDLSLEQARAIGELGEPDVEFCLTFKLARALEAGKVVQGAKKPPDVRPLG
jgi:hypothetical protein